MTDSRKKGTEDEAPGGFAHTGKEVPMQEVKRAPLKRRPVKPPLDPEAALRLFVEGDKPALRDLLVDMMPRLMPIAEAKVKEKAPAKAVVSATIVVMWCNREKFEGNYEAFFAWSCKLLDSQVKNLRRGIRRRERVETSLEECSEWRPELSVELLVLTEAWENFQKMGFVRKYLAKLPLLLQLIIERELSDWTWAEQAEAAGVSHTQIQRLHAKALAMLMRRVKADALYSDYASPGPAGTYEWIEHIVDVLPDDEASLQRDAIRAAAKAAKEAEAARKQAIEDAKAAEIMERWAEQKGVEPDWK